MGNVAGADADDTLGLGGATNDTFNLSDIGPAAQYRGFGILSKSGASVWTLSGAPAGGPALNYVVTAGELNLGTTSQTAASLLLTGGTLSNGTLTVNDPGGFNVQAGTVSAVLAGTGGLTKSTAGTVTLSGANTFTGPVAVNAGVLALSGGAALADSVAVTVTGPGSLNLLASETIGSLAGNGGVTLGANTLTTGGNNGATTYSGVMSGTGGLTKQGTGAFTLSGANTFTGPVAVNAGVLALSGGAALADSVAVTVTGPGSLNLFTSETIGSLAGNGGVTLGANTLTTGGNNGATTYSGVMSGTGGLTKQGTGAFTLSGANTFTGPVAVNAGVLALSGGAALADSVAVTVTGPGSLNLLASETIGSLAGNGGVTLGANTLTTGGNNGATTYSGVMSGTGGLTKQGTGEFTLSGVNTYTGLTDVQAGTLTISATGLVAGAVTNAQGAVTNVDGSVLGAFGNSGELNLISGTIGGALTNNATGVTNVSGANTVGSTNNAAGLISLQNGVFGDSLVTSPGGAYAATGAARMAIDFDNANPNGLQDSIDVNGAASGATNVFIQEFGARRLFAPQTVILTDSGAATFTGAFSGSNGLIAYNLVRNGNNFQVVSSLDANAAGAAAGAVTSSVVAVGTGFIDAASAFISSPANPEADQVTFGFWGRTKGGKYDIDTGTDVSVAGGTDSSASTTFRTSFWGYQFGADFGRLNVGGSGINLHGGLTAGDIDIDTDAKNGSSHADTKAPFIGIYGAATGGGFFADLQVQRNFYRMKLDVPAAGLRNDKVKGDGYSIVFSGGKVIPLNDTWFIEPSVGLNYVTVDTDSVRFDSVGKVKVDDVESLLGRLGLRVGTAFQATENLILRPAVAASVWHEFQGDAGSSFVPDLAGTPSADIKTSRIGTFGQIGLSLSGQMVDSGLLGFVRADYRKGKDIDGYAFTGGLRTQF